jgi:hypothetical protein
VLALGALAYGTWRIGSELFDSNAALKTAVQRANENPVATELLGTPIEPRLWRENTTISFDGKNKMKARFGVHGPKGDGRLQVEAHNNDDDAAWQLDLLLLRVDERDAPIDLLDENGP